MIRAAVVFSTFVLFAAGMGVGAEVVHITTPTEVATRTVKVADPHWKDCSRYWQETSVTIATYASEESQAISTALDTGDYATGVDKVNAVSAKMNRLTAAIRTECKQ